MLDRQRVLAVYNVMQINNSDRVLASGSIHVHRSLDSSLLLYLGLSSSPCALLWWGSYPPWFI